MENAKTDSVQPEENDKEVAQSSEDFGDKQIEGDEEEQEEEEEEEEEDVPTVPKLEEGFYEIEDVRKKRARKGQIQYLIKWRGWPESANTWEPYENLQSCADIIQAYEDRLNKPNRRGRKRKHPLPHPPTSTTPTKKKLCETSPLSTGGDGTTNRAEENNLSHDNHNISKEDDPARKDVTDAGFISIQLNSGVSRYEDDAAHQPLHGAKKRKSGCVRRFKQETPTKDDKSVDKLGCEDVDSIGYNNVVDGGVHKSNKLPDSTDNPSITKIIMPVEYRASVVDGVQQVSIKFKALRTPTILKILVGLMVWK